MSDKWVYPLKFVVQCTYYAIVLKQVCPFIRYLRVDRFDLFSRQLHFEFKMAVLKPLNVSNSVKMELICSFHFMLKLLSKTEQVVS